MTKNQLLLQEIKILIKTIASLDEQYSDLKVLNADNRKNGISSREVIVSMASVSTEKQCSYQLKCDLEDAIDEDDEFILKLIDVYTNYHNQATVRIQDTTNDSDSDIARYKALDDFYRSKLPVLEELANRNRITTGTN